MKSLHLVSVFPRSEKVSCVIVITYILSVSVLTFFHRHDKSAYTHARVYTYIHVHTRVHIFPHIFTGDQGWILVWLHGRELTRHYRLHCDDSRRCRDQCMFAPVDDGGMMVILVAPSYSMFVLISNVNKNLTLFIVILFLQ